jgi:hypothetical protein
LQQRLLYPAYRLVLEDRFINISWKKALEIYFTSIKIYGINADLQFIIGDFLDLNALHFLNRFISEIGALPTIQDFDNCADFRTDFYLDINFIEQMSIIVFCGARFRVELPVVFSRMKKIIKQFGIKVFSIGYNDDIKSVKIIDIMLDCSRNAEGRNKLFRVFYLDNVYKI